MTKVSLGKKMTKVTQKTKDKAGNDAHIFSLFLSKLLTRPVSLNGKFHVKSEPQLHFSKPCQCCRQHIFFKGILYLSFQSLRHFAEHWGAWEQHYNFLFDGGMWLQKDLMHGTVVPLDQDKDEVDRPTLNHITSFCFYSSLLAAMIPHRNEQSQD